MSFVAPDLPTFIGPGPVLGLLVVVPVIVRPIVVVVPVVRSPIVAMLNSFHLIVWSESARWVAALLMKVLKVSVNGSLIVPSVSNSHSTPFPAQQCASSSYQVRRCSPSCRGVCAMLGSGWSSVGALLLTSRPEGLQCACACETQTFGHIALWECHQSAGVEGKKIISVQKVPEATVIRDKTHKDFNAGV